MTISPEQLQAWKRLADDATSGPWDSYFETGLNPMVVTYTENEKGLRSLKDAVVHGRSIADNNFIAAARTAVPALIEAYEKQEKQLAYYAVLLRRCSEAYDKLVNKND